MQTVDFIRMEDGTREEYEFLDRLEHEYVAGLPDRLMESLRKLENSLSGYRINRLEHSLQGATRAQRAGESDEMVIAVLLHDIGDELAPYSHSEMAAAILRPFVSEKIYWIVKHHGVFQMYYYAHHCGMRSISVTTTIRTALIRITTPSLSNFSSRSCVGFWQSQI
jgi:predicted HD phosphohydrolase